MLDLAPICVDGAIVYDEADFDTVIDGQTFTTPQSLDTGDDNTLYKNCTFENITGDALTIRNVDNVVVYRCAFSNLTGNGVRLRSSGSTSNVIIDGNTIDDADLNGITAAQRSQDNPAVDHPGLVVKNNTITNAGDSSSSHGIYVQTTEFEITDNTLRGVMGGNAISVRSSGTVSGNDIDCRSRDGANGSGIKYFSDHKTGSSKTLTVESNVINGDNSAFTGSGVADLGFGIEVKRAGSEPIAEDDWIVNTFNISGNTITGVGTNIEIDTAISSESWYTGNFS